MQLDRARHRELAQLVFLSIGANADPAMLKELVGWEAIATAPRATNGYQFAVWVVDHALRCRTAEVFIRVVRRVDGAGTLVELHALVDMLEANPSAWSPEANIGTLWAPPKWPFVGRDPLRSILVSMAEGDGPGSLAIEGPLGHGKNALTSYIVQLADETERFQTVVRELRREPRPGLLNDMVADFRVKLELDPELETTHAELDRHGQVLARDLAQEAPLAPAAQPVWLVANVLDPTGVEDGVLPFIDELLLQIKTGPGLAAKVRVVLLSESASLLELENLPEAQHRHVLLPDIGQGAVAAWLAAVAPGKDETLYTVASERVFVKMEENPPPPEERLQQLARGCMKARRMLLAAGAG